MSMGNGNIALLLAILSICLLGCAEDNQPEEQASTSTVTAEAPQETPEKAGSMPYGPRELSQIDFKGLFNRVPSALDIGRDGRFVFFKLLLEEQQHGIYSAQLDSSGVGNPEELLRDQEFNIAYISAHPVQNECLVTTNYIAEDGHVHNRIWRVGPGLMEEVAFEQTKGLPADHNESTFKDLKPFYSWNGEQVIIPLDHFGVIVVNLGDSSSKWVALPFPKIEVTGTRCSNLPDMDEERGISFIVWEAQSRDEKCRIFTLDLDALEQFELVTDQTFVIYRFSGPDLQFEPWLMHGSRLPDYLESKRQPRIVLYDQESDQIRDLELGGDPEFNLEIGHHGTQLAYMDRVRQALVRLDVASGELSTDDRWFSSEARIFFAGEDNRIFVWHRDIFIEAFQGTN